MCGNKDDIEMVDYVDEIETEDDREEERFRIQQGNELRDLELDDKNSRGMNVNEKYQPDEREVEDTRYQDD